MKSCFVYLIDIHCVYQLDIRGVPMAKTSPINMRVEPSQQALLTKAAQIMNKDRSSFIIEVACREAENVLLDQRLFHLDSDRFEQFDALLSAPLPTDNKLQELLSTPSPWEQ